MKLRQAIEYELFEWDLTSGEVDSITTRIKKALEGRILYIKHQEGDYKVVFENGERMTSYNLDRKGSLHGQATRALRVLMGEEVISMLRKFLGEDAANEDFLKWRQEKTEKKTNNVE